MNKHAIYHRAKSHMSYAVAENRVHIRLKSERNDLTSVYLLTDSKQGWVEGDDGKWHWHKRKLPMEREFQTELFDYWFVEVEPIDYKMRYGFLVSDGTETLYYLDRGFFPVEDPSIGDDINSYFAFPYVHTQDLFQAPSWVKDTVWYQIFPERFANGDASRNPNDVLPWNKKDEDLGQYSFYGGDIRGIIEKLDYIKGLGMSGIYMTPVFKATTSHKYDTINYYEIDPHFGTKEDLKELVEKAHQLDMKVMLDAVFNHIGDKSPQFQDVLENGKESKYFDWFMFEETEGAIDDWSYRNFVPAMPKLNTANPEVIDYLLDISRYWIEETNIDGWRLDVANEVDHEFWRLFRKAVKEVKEDLYICGEIWHDSQAWLYGDQFDGVMNYPLSQPIQDWIATGRINGNQFQNDFVHALLRYSEPVNQGMFTLLDSHDTPRITHIAKGDKRKVDMCLALLMSVPGAISIYYGTEIYLEGGADPDNRRCMPWDEDVTFSNIAKINHLRSDYEVFGSGGKFEFLLVDANTVIYKKTNKQNGLYFIFHTKGEAVIEWPEEMKGKSFKNLVSEEKMEAGDTVTLNEFTYYILEPRG
ncbi:glycoside hydrolase family 13 protein [Alkalihalobacillus pseudalcaliphilus]|uniref:glycoside hydrolase family 13 protein n=1 Tax=Alkalihalobacillus pseudalcaliphilus TaxID=79884 RepID=UPI00064D9FA2|nr:glycoside hydrolase family 13 protein [Alkalihalobacillus pseudalcaliphilus]KMK77570.1 alpha-amylase [Alkalihalobacillus pseudalcaliphilus]